jgi:hypothetical protein
MLCTLKVCSSTCFWRDRVWSNFDIVTGRYYIAVSFTFARKKMIDYLNGLFQTPGNTLHIPPPPMSRTSEKLTLILPSQETWNVWYALLKSYKNSRPLWPISTKKHHAFITHMCQIWLQTSLYHCNMCGRRLMRVFKHSRENSGHNYADIFFILANVLIPLVNSKSSVTAFSDAV